MRNALLVASREFAASFRSLLAYVFLTLFVVALVLPHVLTVMPLGRADLRAYFDSMPWCIVIFSSLVTMRSWAEERQENTYEMLLTFPMRDRDLVLGKFLAAFGFICVGIAASLSVPLILGWIGDPDWGAVFSGYVGAVLVAAAWCAVGVWISGLTRVQLAAGMVSLTLGVLWLSFGTDVMTSLTDSIVPGGGRVLRSLFGAWHRFEPFGRGVVELADVAWFVGTAAIFLYLNTLHLSLRRHPQAGRVLALGTALGLGSALLLGRLADGSWARADMTEDRIHTLSPGTVRILGRAAAPVRATLYISPKDEMPSEFQTLERDLRDKLEEMSAATGGKLVLTVKHKRGEDALAAMEEEQADEEEAAISLGGDDEAAKPKKEKRKGDRDFEKGVRPFNVLAQEGASQTSKLVFATLGLAYRDRDEELIEAVFPQRLPELEYLVASTVARLVRDRAPRVAVHLGREQMDPQLEEMYRKIGRAPPGSPYAGIEQALRADKIDVIPAALNAYEPMPDDADALMLIGPESLSERARWEVNRFLASGKPVLIALHRYEWKYEMGQRGIMIKAPREIESGLDEVLAAQGLGVSRDVLLDENHVPVQIRTGTVQDLLGGASVRSPTHVVVSREGMDPQSALTQRLDTLFYLWGTPVTIDRGAVDRHGLSVQTLFSSGPRSCVQTPTPGFRGFKLVVGGETSPSPLAVDVRGTFADAFAGTPRPAWPVKLEMTADGRPRPVPPDAPETPLAAAPGRLILTGSAWMFQSGLLGMPGTDNREFLFRCVDALTLDSDISLVRSKQPKDRRFPKPTAVQQAVSTWVPTVVVPAALAALGLVIGTLRLRRRESWRETHGR
ncbi:MAG: hypothetical protein HMLKMBBP_00242 [Planctomycetes bacterium]|nr:hypothetical protein [Planctomycetota bacterium]